MHSLTAQRRARLNRRSLQLAYATAGYNLLEGVVAIAVGTAASSAALIGFGLDSFIEVSSALVVIWQFHSRVPEARERLALKLIAVSFFALAAWVTFSAARAMLGPGEAAPSTVGIALAAVSLIVMPLLVWAKRQRSSRIPHRHCSALTFRRSFSSASGSTRGSAGRGPTRWRPSSSPASRSRRAYRHGGASSVTIARAAVARREGVTRPAGGVGRGRRLPGVAGQAV